MKDMIKKINNTFYSIFLIIFLVLPLYSCSDLPFEEDSLVFFISDTSDINKKQNSYSENPTLEYYQSVEWTEPDYGTYLLHQDVSFNIDDTSISQKTTKLDAACTATYHPCRYEDLVIKQIPESYELKFIRSKPSDFKELKINQEEYNKISSIFLFINSSESKSRSEYSYIFSSPIPFLPIASLSSSSYLQALSDDIILNYTYKSTNPDDILGEAQLIIHLEEKNSSYIKIKITNILNNYDEFKDPKQIANKQAERYGYFPLPKEMIYTINLDKGGKITEYQGDTENLISQFNKGTSSAYLLGNVAPIKINTKLCKQEQSQKIETFSCGK